MLKLTASPSLLSRRTEFQLPPGSCYLLTLPGSQMWQGGLALQHLPPISSMCGRLEMATWSRSGFAMPRLLLYAGGLANAGSWPMGSIARRTQLGGFWKDPAWQP